MPANQNLNIDPNNQFNNNPLIHLVSIIVNKWPSYYNGRYVDAMDAINAISLSDTFRNRDYVPTHQELRITTGFDGNPAILQLKMDARRDAFVYRKFWKICQTILPILTLPATGQTISLPDTIYNQPCFMFYDITPDGPIFYQFAGHDDVNDVCFFMNGMNPTICGFHM